MAKVIRPVARPKAFSAGTVVAGVVVVIAFNVTGGVGWVTLLIAFVLLLVVDALVYRPPKKLTEDVLEIRDEI